MPHFSNFPIRCLGLRTWKRKEPEAGFGKPGNFVRDKNGSIEHCFSVKLKESFRLLQFEGQLLAGYWMVELQFPGKQEQAKFSKFLRASRIQVIAHHRTSNVGEMGTNLMSSTCNQVDCNSA